MKKLGGMPALVAVEACDPTTLPPAEPTSALGFVVRPVAIRYPSPDSSSR